MQIQYLTNIQNHYLQNMRDEKECKGVLMSAPQLSVPRILATLPLCMVKVAAIITVEPEISSQANNTWYACIFYIVLDCLYLIVVPDY